MYAISMSQGIPFSVFLTVFFSYIPNKVQLINLTFPSY